MPKISIVIPIYNLEDYLAECLDSVAAQTFTDYEVILVDDGSTDRSGQICDQYAANDRRISTVHIENGGASHARNIGLQRAMGNYIGFIDGDDWIENTYLENLYELITQYDADVSVTGLVRVENGRYQPFVLSEKPLILKGQDALNQISNPARPWVSWVWGKLYRAALLQEIRFDEEITICEDSLYNSQVFSHVDKVVLSNKCLYNYRIRPTSTTRSASKIPEELYTKIMAFEKILEIAADYPGSEFEYMAKKTIVFANLYYLISFYRSKGYDAVETARIRERLEALSQDFDMRRLPVKTYIKWLMLKFSPRLLCLLETHWRVGR